MTVMGTAPRISVLLASYSVTGVPRITLSLVRELAIRDYRVDFVLLSGRLPEGVRRNLGRSVRLIELQRQRTMHALPSLWRYFRRERPAGVISAEEHLNVVALVALRAARSNARISISFHVPPDLGHERPIWDSRRWPLMVGRWVYPWADAIVPISQAMGEQLANATGIDRDRLKVIYNPVVSDWLVERSRELIAPDCLDESSRFILGVGTLDPRKGFLDLLTAFAFVRRSRDMHLVILGEGKQRKELESRVVELGLEGTVSLPGAVANPYAWMARAEVFVLPSYFEGLPTVLIEAMACGCPVVATDCPTGPREILDEGRYGKLVPMRDPERLAEAILETLATAPDREALLERARAFHVDRVMDEYLGALGLLAAEPHAARSIR